MKYKLIIYLVMALLLMSCEDSHVLKPLEVDQVTFGNCKTITKKSENAERIEYKTVDHNYLQINHINVWFNCEPGQLLVDVNRLNDTIYVDENEETAMVNCICPYDLCYRIGPMDYGLYIIVIQRGGLLYTKFPVDFNANTDNFFQIN